LIIHNLVNNPQFYGRRKGRKLSRLCQLALKDGKDYLIKEVDISDIFHNHQNIVLEIGFGDGENLINSAKINSNIFYIGSDPFINTTAKCLSKILQHNLKNIVIWPDDVRKILKLFPNNSISEVKILFPDPWPKKKHINRRLIQNDFIEIIYPIIRHQGTITIATDHDLLKKWVLEKFQNYTEFEWIVESSNDWRFRPSDCFQTKYELKSINQQRKPSWFVFKKK
tara:strand:- start:148 stop:822 length:675 start_codon:yes stop_codon:yes gene_type:complete